MTESDREFVDLFRILIAIAVGAVAAVRLIVQTYQESSSGNP